MYAVGMLFSQEEEGPVLHNSMKVFVIIYVINQLCKLGKTRKVQNYTKYEGLAFTIAGYFVDFPNPLSFFIIIKQFSVSLILMILVVFFLY